MKDNMEANNQENQYTEEQLAAALNTDENIAGTEGLEDAVDADADEKLQIELAEAKDKYLRLAAEFENYKRRTSKERLELIQTAGKDIIQSLLEVLDDSERAEKNLETSEDLAQIKEGIQLVFNKLRNTLQARGLKVMEANGADFDPEIHDAITEIPTGDEAMAGKVVDVVVPGYYLNDKIIRHAKVVVGK
ncbi:MAG: nucleotide exchange factor GrpE [Bacteroidetes bacterium]|nr:nucleotide exchange factor GrpE [Bacteroidota bacterium]